MSLQQEARPQESVMGSPVRKILVREIIRDIQARLSDTQLVAKYHLSEKQLQAIFRKLLDSGLLSPFEFQAWAIFCNKTVPLKNIRLFPRDAVGFAVPVYDADEPENRGTVLDISENGIGVKGIRASVNDIKTLVIPTEQFLGMPPLVFEARCVWTRAHDSELRSGFYLIDASAKIWQELRKYVRSRPENSSDKP
jgi:hypothetical protein